MAAAEGAWRDSAIPPEDELLDGEASAGAGPDFGTKAYTGREWDQETGLYYYRARYYDAKVGGFIAQDSIEFLDGKTKYGYVLANPARYTDPSGHVASGASGSCAERGQETLSSVCELASSGKITNGLVQKCLDKKCKTPLKVNCPCTGDCDREAKMQGVRFIFGFISPGSNTISLCPRGSNSPCQMGRTIVHELLHDCGYGMELEDQIESWSKSTWKCGK